MLDGEMKWQEEVKGRKRHSMTLQATDERVWEAHGIAYKDSKEEVKSWVSQE